MKGARPHRSVRFLVETVALAIGYAITAKIGFLAAISPGNVTLVWPPSGLSVGAALTLGIRRTVLGVFLGSFLVNLWSLRGAVSLPVALGLSAAIALGSTLQTAAAAHALRRWSGIVGLFGEEEEAHERAMTKSAAERSLPDEAARAVGLSALACLVAASVGVTGLALAGLVPWARFAFTWGTWWLGDLIGIIVITPLVMAIRQRLRGKPLGQGAVFVAGSLGIYLSVATFIITFTLETSKVRAELEADGALLAESLGQTTSLVRAGLQSIAGVHAARGTITRDEFRIFVRSSIMGERPLPGLLALSFNDRVDDVDRAAYEAAAQKDGRADFRITEHAADGTLVPAGQRPEYMVVAFIEPVAGNESLLGFDVASSDIRRETFERARDSGSAAASAPLELIQKQDGSQGILLFEPIYRRDAPKDTPEARRENLVGFAVGVFVIRDLLEAALASGQFDGVDVFLHDDALGAESAPIAVRRGGSGAHAASDKKRVDPRADVYHATSLDVGGRRWTAIVNATPQYMSARRTWVPWIVLTTSLVVTLFVAAYLQERARAEALLEAERASLARRVEERTADLRRANTDLARAVKVRDEFVANMSHELRTPLNAILGYAELLLQGVLLPIDERLQEPLQTIQSAGRHLLELINDILDFSTSEAGKITLYPEDVDLLALCKESMCIVEAGAQKKQLRLELCMEATPDRIRVDPKRMKQVLVNLLGNAVKFTPARGAVTLRVSSGADGAGLLLAVEDTGPGIAEADLGRLFQPFSQLDAGLSRRHEGTGLGLVLVRRFVEMHGGSVSVKSEVGRGSVFTVALPARSEDPRSSST